MIKINYKGSEYNLTNIKDVNTLLSLPNVPTELREQVKFITFGLRYGKVGKSDELSEVFGGKTPEMQAALKKLFPNTENAILDSRCTHCESPIIPSDFTDDLSRKECGVSGLCQVCQDKVWGVK